MRALHGFRVISVLVLLLFASSFSHVFADGINKKNEGYSTSLKRSSLVETLLPNSRKYANACGLCSNVDCCGGASLGWKLCKSNCPTGQYKCLQVATCP